MKLYLCAGCNRHIKDDAASCPFCGAARGALVGDTLRVPARVNRATQLLLGASVGAAVALAATSCSSNALYGCTSPPPICPEHDAAVLPKDAADEGDATDASPDDSPSDATSESTDTDSGD